MGFIGVLPEAPNFGALLSRGIGQGAGQGFAKGIDKASEFAMEMAKEKHKQQLGQQLFEKIRGSSQPIQGMNGEMEGSQTGFTPDQLLQMKMSGNKQLGEVADFIMKQEESALNRQKIKRDLGEKTERAENLLGTISDMEEMIPYVGGPFGTKTFGGELRRETIQKRDEFDTLAADIASFFRDLETKGALPQGLYEKVIEPRLPSSKLSERENKGRLNAVKKLAKRYGRIRENESFKSSEKPSLEDLADEYLH